MPCFRGKNCIFTLWPPRYMHNLCIASIALSSWSK
ncbi:hypothetical protein B4U79_03768 [Dinothrombium tinctorium]|uniref:Uncharacterized protein n=1 Tax=Dinothrombium tinctorium TaxID=1965070 RepID=A0A3S3PDJ3_9ACAR|nr:hypothetical protein B4U79_03768 [Dinothrombium tinctorium]